jgi:hypothetical protein
MEINGRYWGSLQLAIDAGVDFPRLHLDVAEGHGPASPPEYRAGIRSRWELGDLDHLLTRLIRRDRDLFLPPGSPGRLRTLWDVLRPRGGDRREVLRLDDPRPFARELLGWLRGETS